mmetsp:Transcript_14500/g.35338  ORF Transcript_14500/g.35338 Transcript_14500/m.35338 type:complete len:123 (-) Transcript_14500:202-570(-)
MKDLFGDLFFSNTQLSLFVAQFGHIVNFIGPHLLTSDTPFSLLKFHPSFSQDHMQHTNAKKIAEVKELDSSWLHVPKQAPWPMAHLFPTDVILPQSTEKSTYHMANIMRLQQKSTGEGLYDE